MAFVTTSARRFVVAGLDARGELHSRAEYRYEELERLPRASEMIATFSSAIWKSPEAFEVAPVLAGTKVDCRWRASAESAGIVTFRCNAELSSLSLLASGKDAQADQITLAAFQQHLLQELHDTGYEPAFDLVELTDRPLIATINMHSPAEQVDRLTTALADRCFAASYFRFQGLA